MASLHEVHSAWAYQDDPDNVLDLVQEAIFDARTNLDFDIKLLRACRAWDQKNIDKMSSIAKTPKLIRVLYEEHAALVQRAKSALQRAEAMMNRTVSTPMTVEEAESLVTLSQLAEYFANEATCKAGSMANRRGLDVMRIAHGSSVA